MTLSTFRFTDVLEWLDEPWAQALAVLSVGFLLTVAAKRIGFPIARRIAARTPSTVDDAVVAWLERPVLWSLGTATVTLALGELPIGGWLRLAVSGIGETVIVAVWSVALFRGTDQVLDALVARHEDRAVVQARTAPLFEILAKVAIIATGLYLLLLAWHVDVTGWLASAGIIGLALSFAAKDTLGHFIAGLSIIADAPYRIGDVIVLDDGTRGTVRDIGLRSTRILTRDDIEITVPNSLIANGRIVNESGGPSRRTRLRLPVGVAYGSNVAQVRQVLLGCARGVPHVCADPEPRVWFVGLGASSLDFEVVVWLVEPIYREVVIDILYTAIYDALNAAGIGIPFPQRDVHIRTMPFGFTPRDDSAA